MQEIRYAVGQFRRSRALFVVAVLLLTIGIGASALIFTVADALLLRPLPVSHPENLVALFEHYPNICPQSHLPNQLYEEIRQHSSTLSDVMGYLDVTAPLEREANAERAYI